MKKSTLIWIGVLGIASYGAYHFYFSKTAYAKRIKNSGMSEGSLETLKSFDMGFLRAWSKAAISGSSTFTYENKVFTTKGGRAQK